MFHYLIEVDNSRTIRVTHWFMSGIVNRNPSNGDPSSTYLAKDSDTGGLARHVKE
jgi:hypothetical protein